jgi:hypothetical protein
MGKFDSRRKSRYSNVGSANGFAYMPTVVRSAVVEEESPARDGSNASDLVPAPQGEVDGWDELEAGIAAGDDDLPLPDDELYDLDVSQIRQSPEPGEAFAPLRAPDMPDAMRPLSSALQHKAHEAASVPQSAMRGPSEPAGFEARAAAVPAQPAGARAEPFAPLSQGTRSEPAVTRSEPAVTRSEPSAPRVGTYTYSQPVPGGPSRPAERIFTRHSLPADKVPALFSESPSTLMSLPPADDEKSRASLVAKEHPLWTLSKMSLAAGDLEDALGTLEQLFKVEPDHELARAEAFRVAVQLQKSELSAPHGLFLLVHYAQTGRVAEACAVYRTLRLIAAPLDEGCLLSAIMAADASGDAALVLEATNLLLKGFPGCAQTPRALLLTAKHQLLAGARDAAKNTLNYLVNAFPNDPAAAPARRKLAELAS